MKNIHLLIIILAFSCDIDKNIIQGNWVVDGAYINDSKLQWDLLDNMISLKGDGVCRLPLVRFQDRGTNKELGTWDSFTKNDSVFLDIHSRNEVFGKLFYVEYLKKVESTEVKGYYGYKMKLRRDSLTFVCSRLAL